MKHYCDEWVQEWCQENGWSDLYVEQNQYWAFRPNAVMPEPIPSETLQSIKQHNGLSPQEKRWSITAIVATIIGLVMSLYFLCPIFLILVFGFDSFTIANIDPGEI